MVRGILQCLSGLLGAFVLIACVTVLFRSNGPSVVAVPEIRSQPIVVAGDAFNRFETNQGGVTWRFLAVPGGLIVLGVAALYFMSRRRRVVDETPHADNYAESDALDAAEMRKRRREAEVIRRMYGVMDRIENRVERLESSLLP